MWRSRPAGTPWPRTRAIPTPWSTWGRLYYEAKNYPKALEWVRRGASAGLPAAQYNLASLYYEGKGVQQDFAQAIKWFRAAAAQGHARSQFMLGYMAAEGQGMPASHVEAIRWFLPAAEQGDPNALYGLGLAYFLGGDVPVDYGQAYFWLCLAAERGMQQAAPLRDKLQRELPPDQAREAERLCREALEPDPDEQKTETGKTAQPAP